MKKALAAISITCTFVLILFFTQYSWMSPVNDILGCYNLSKKTYTDRVCLYSNGQYEQFYISNGSAPEKYNTSSFRSFSHTNDLGTFVAITLSEFMITDSNGELESITNIEIQPFQNLFGSVLFTRGRFKEYYLE